MLDIHRKRYRVAQWGTGNVGLRSLRAVIEHPQMDLVGVFVYTDSKVGRDAGELCGTEPTGVIATRSIDDILAAKPDCVLHMAGQPELDVVCRLLAAGCNVMSTRMEFHDRDSLAPEVREALEEACRVGGTSLHSSGSSPGISTEVLPLALTSMARRLDCYTIEECADISTRNSPEMIFGGLKFGSPLSAVEGNRAAGAIGSSGPSMRMTAAALGLPLDEIVGSIEYAVATRRVEIAAGVIEAGTIAAQRTSIDGLRNGKVIFKRRGTLFATHDLDPAWDVQKGWHILVEGDTPIEIRWSYPVSEEDWAAFTPGLTAHRPVNAVPYVCEAPPGIQTTATLPLIVANLGP